ncbi:MAG: ABC transporter permease [Cyclobacteriaceae bacterium]
MLRNYLLIAIRNLTKRRGYSIINISGLAIGFAVCILMTSYIKQELSYDSMHSKADRVVRLVYETQSENETRGIAKTPFPLKAILRNNYPQVEKVVRLYNSTWLSDQSRIQADAKIFMEEKFFFADPEFFDVFDFKLLKGNPHTALSKTESVVLTESIALKYFGAEDPIGKIIRYQNQIDLEVTGVVEDVPQSSHVHFNFLAPVELQRVLWKIAANNFYDFEEDWNWSGAWSYLLLRTETDLASFEHQIQSIPDQFMEQGNSRKITFHVQPIQDIHLHSNLSAEIQPNSSMSQVVGFIAIVSLILIIAIVNFVNLATARATERAKEVGLRKVVGALRHQLVSQFLAEAIVITFISILISGLLAELVLPLFNTLTASPVSIDFQDWRVPVLLAACAIIIGIIAGSYPALYLSSQKPVKTIKGLVDKPSAGNLAVRNVLVVLQFSITTFLIIGILIVKNQISFMSEKSLGFDKDQIVILTNGNQLRGYDSFKQKLLTLGPVTDVYRGYMPGESGMSNTFDVEGIDKSVRLGLNYVGDNFTSMFNLKIIAGRKFKPDLSDTSKSAIINESAVRLLGWNPESAISKKISFIGGSDNKTRYDLTVIGVINDANFQSLHREVQPQVFMNETWGKIALKIDPVHWKTASAAVSGTWSDFVPDWPFDYEFLNENFASLYENEERLARVITFFAVIAICIASMGLVGIVSLTTQYRSREIGIRKVLGASRMSIWVLISRNYLVLLTAAFFLSLPFSYYYAQSWLQSFAFRVSLSPFLFVFGGILVVVIATISVGWQSLRASRQNPIQLIRQD